jgi:hypothetical protein
MKTLKPEIYLNNILEFGSCPTRNSLSPHYKDQQVNDVREIITVYSENHTKHINTHCGHDTEFFKAAASDRYSNHWALNSSLSTVSPLGFVLTASTSSQPSLLLTSLLSVSATFCELS